MSEDNNKPAPQPAPQPSKNQADIPASPRPEINIIRDVRRDSVDG
jgi:hypothetical protein